MNVKSVKAFLAFMRGCGISTDILLDYKNNVSVGEFHFTNGVHFPVLISGVKADGVYIDNNYIIADCERDKPTTLSRARRFCKNRDCILPPPEARDKMIRGGEPFKLSSALRSLGFPRLEDDDYWAEGDLSYDSNTGSIGDVYTDTNGTPPDSLYKRVRGCKRVEPVVAFEVQELFSPFGYILSELLRPDFSYQEYLDGLGISLPTAGWYLLNQDKVSKDTLYDSEKAIFVTPNLCLELNIFDSPMTAQEADAYCRFYGMETPSDEQLLLLQKYAPEVNHALLRVNMDDIQIPQEHIEELCWSASTLYDALHDEQKPYGKRWYLPILKRSTVPEIYVILNELGIKKSH